jgi:exopolyphosphatase/guanosine-5'-triphosphate,3'-diphosphate pyrophosphatase
LSALNPDRVLAYGTAALRQARNAADFIRQAETETGIRLQILDGHAEAEMIWQGVRQAVTGMEEPSLVMDIGGGSTELILCTPAGIEWLDSFPLGVSLLRQRLAPSDPLRPEDVEAIEAEAERTLRPFFAALKKRPAVTRLIGSAGSFDTFRALSCWRDTGAPPPEAIAGELNVADFHRLHHLLTGSTAAERARMPGMDPARIDTIAIASVLVTFVLRRMGIRRLTWSGYSLKEGMLYSAVAGLSGQPRA